MFDALRDAEDAQTLRRLLVELQETLPRFPRREAVRSAIQSVVDRITAELADMSRGGIGPESIPRLGRQVVQVRKQVRRT